ncbi:hypothetical protein D3C87_1847220 [compost metagenome]
MHPIFKVRIDFAVLLKNPPVLQMRFRIRSNHLFKLHHRFGRFRETRIDVRCHCNRDRRTQTRRLTFLWYVHYDIANIRVDLHEQVRIRGPSRNVNLPDWKSISPELH